MPHRKTGAADGSLKANQDEYYKDNRYKREGSNASDDI